jgi:hypothetical protein
MTIVKVIKSDKEIITKTLLEAGIGVTFYTMENNDNILQAEIDCDDPGQLWHLGKMTGHSISLEDMKKIL